MSVRYVCELEQQVEELTAKLQAAEARLKEMPCPEHDKTRNSTFDKCGCCDCADYYGCCWCPKTQRSEGDE